MFVFYKYFKNNIWLNFLSGIPSPGVPGRYNTLIKLNAAVSLIVHVYTIVACSAVIIEFGDATDISQVVGRLGMDSEALIYTLYYAYNRKKLEAIAEKIEELISALLADPLTRDKDVVNVIDSQYMKLKYYTSITFGVVSTLPTIYAVPRLLRYYGLLDQDGKRDAYQAPNDTSYSPAYEITLFLQTSSLTYACLKNLASEAFFLAMLALQTALYNYLNDVFADVFKPDEELCEDCREKYTSNNTKIRKWIKFHQQVIWIGNSLLRFYAPILLVYFSLLYSEVVSLTLTLTTTKNMYSTEDKTIIILYWIIRLMDLLVLSVYGTKLADNTLNVADRGFNSTWYNCSPQVKNTAKMIFIRVRQMLRATALGLFSFDLSTESFVTIIKSMVSFYIALVKIKKQRNQQQQLE